MIDEIGCISEVRKKFYISIIEKRYSQILKKNYDKLQKNMKNRLEPIVQSIF